MDTQVSKGEWSCFFCTVQDYSPASQVYYGGDLSDIYFYQTQLSCPLLTSDIQAPAALSSEEEIGIMMQG